MNQKIISHYCDGRQVESHSPETMEIVSPNDGEVIGSVSIGDEQDLNRSVESAKKAFEVWSNTHIKDRIKILFKTKRLFRKYTNELAELCSLENGKTVEEAKAGIEKSIELIEYAGSLPQITEGRSMEVSDGIECKMVRYPFGVTAGIVPFNFPIMVPMWMIPLTLGCGNTFILKPSEHVPCCALRLAEIFTEAGLPDGVFNIVNGTKNVVEAICCHPDIQAVAFVGSSKTAEIVYKRATGNGKRALALGGAKNHLIVMEDADIEMTAHDVVRSSMGSAGQRCMAVHTMVAVGDVQPVIDRIVELASGIETGKDMGGVITPASAEKITKIIDEAEKSGAKILLDGRKVTVKGKEKGFYIGPTILDNLTPGMPLAKEEIFGPVLSILRVDTLDEAIEIENNNEYGNAASIFTSNGSTASEFEERANSGMVGINIGIPVPREPFSFGGWNRSVFGVGDLTGSGCIHFWTKQKKITSKWFINKAKHWLG